VRQKSHYSVTFCLNLLAGTSLNILPDFVTIKVSGSLLILASILPISAMQWYDTNKIIKIIAAFVFFTLCTAVKL
jgi:hypothetical protein